MPNGTVWSLDAFIRMLAESSSFAENKLETIINYLNQLNPKDVFDDDLSILQIQFD